MSSTCRAFSKRDYMSCDNDRVVGWWSRRGSCRFSMRCSVIAASHQADYIAYHHQLNYNSHYATSSRVSYILLKTFSIIFSSHNSIHPSSRLRNPPNQAPRSVALITPSVVRRQARKTLRRHHADRTVDFVTIFGSSLLAKYPSIGGWCGEWMFSAVYREDNRPTNAYIKDFPRIKGNRSTFSSFIRRVRHCHV